MKKIPIYLKLAVVFVLVILSAAAIKGGNGSFDFSQIIAYVILIIAVFSFGLFMMFSLENRKERINSIKDSLRKQDAHLLNIYQFSKFFAPSVTEKIINHIDSYLITQIDYRIEDTDRSSESLADFFDLARQIKASTEEQRAVKMRIMNNLEEISLILKEVSFKATDRMSGYEWISLLALFFVIVFGLFYENTNSLVCIFIISIIATALALLLFILRELDRLHWQEQYWVWNPLVNLFKELGLVPYFPEIIFKTNRVAIKKIRGLTKARIAIYKYPYPNFKGKKIKIVKV
ncbi:MAG: hypothetical protein WC022_00235 [Parcubacteria group bacterium]